jgi:hypothetical protein
MKGPHDTKAHQRLDELARRVHRQETLSVEQRRKVVALEDLLGLREKPYIEMAEILNALMDRSHPDHDETKKAALAFQYDEAMASELAEWKASFDLYYDASQRAIKMWQEAHPDQADIWPDQANLIVWLMEELTGAKQWVDDLQSDMYINCVYCGHRSLVLSTRCQS